MTPLDTMRKLFKDVGMDFTEFPASDATEINFPNAHTRLELSAKTSGVIGYWGFCTDFYFDKDGNLLGAGLWE